MRSSERKTSVQPLQIMNIRNKSPQIKEWEDPWANRPMLPPHALTLMDSSGKSVSSKLSTPQF